MPSIITKPTVGLSGWNTATDSLIDQWNQSIAVHTISASGTTQALNPTATGAHKLITLTANCTFTLTGAVAGVEAWLHLILKQDATGNRLVTWPASVKWSGGAPVLSSTPNAVDRLLVATYDGGVTYYGDMIGKGYA